MASVGGLPLMKKWSSTVWISVAAGLPALAFAGLSLVLALLLARQGAMMRAQRVELDQVKRALVLEEQVQEILVTRRSSAPVAEKVRFNCPHCFGDGYLMEGTGHEIDRVKYGCPVCHGKGMKQMVLPVGATLCTTCKGMGLRGYERRDNRVGHKRLAARICPTCRGEGYTKP